MNRTTNRTTSETAEPDSLHAHQPDSFAGGTRVRGKLPAEPDPLIRALARYVEALHRRYPEGSDELRREGLDARAKVSRMVKIRKDAAS